MLISFYFDSNAFRLTAWIQHILQVTLNYLCQWDTENIIPIFKMLFGKPVFLKALFHNDS